MKALPLFSLLVALSLGAAPNAGLKPVWEDNFDAKELDPKKWNSGGGSRIVDGKLQHFGSSEGDPLGKQRADESQQERATIAEHVGEQTTGG